MSKNGKRNYAALLLSVIIAIALSIGIHGKTGFETETQTMRIKGYAEIDIKGSFTLNATPAKGQKKE